MSNSASYQRIVPVWTNISLNHSDFEALLNLLPDAAMLIDRPIGRILLINSNLIKLTAFTYADLVGAPLETLLPEIEQTKISNGVDQPILLKRRARESIPVIIKIQPIDSEGQRQLVTITPLEKYNENQPEEWNRRVKHIQSLAKLIEEPNLDSALKHAIRIAESFLDTSYVCIYMANNDIPSLRLYEYRDHNGIFPKELPSLDLVKLSKTTIWRPGKRVLTNIHQAAHSAKLCFLASAPLGQIEGLSGLLVAGSESKEPANHLTNLMNIVASIVTNAISHYILIENLQNENRFLRKQEIIYRILDENMQQGVVILDHEQKIIQINPAAEIMLEYKNSEVQSQSVENVLIGSDTIMPTIEDAYSGKPCRVLENAWLHKRNGQSFPVTFDIIPITKKDVVSAVILLIDDMTEKEQIRQRTSQLKHRAMLGELYSVFAHEVRNPINNISTGLELLASRLDESDPNRDIVSRTQGDCERLNSLVESTLSFARPVESTQFEAMDISELIKRVLNRWESRLNKADIQSYFQSQENLPKIMGDPRSLERVFINLISNAVKAMDQVGGLLAIKVKLNNEFPNNPQVEVTVSDSGLGIPDEIRNHLFEPFVTASVEGTGLGLAITKQIITSHRGSIKVDTFTGGTVFHIFLPAADGVPS